jgi:PAS domain S-box-containing protein
MKGNPSQSPLSSAQLRQNPHRFEHIFGLSVCDYDTLLQRLVEDDREPKISSTEKRAEEVIIALLSMRQSMTQEVLSACFGIDEAAVGDIINRLQPRLEDVLALHLKGSAVARNRKQLIDPPKNIDEAQRLLQELQIHQVELTAQNEELKISRAETEKQLLRYTELYEFAPMGYFTVARDGTLIQSANLTAERLMGLPRSEFLHQPFVRFIEEESRLVVHDLFKKAFARATADEPEGCEVKMLGKGQKPLWAHIKAVVSTDGQLCRIAVLDITERKEAEEALRESEQKLRLTFETISEGVALNEIVYDEAGEAIDYRILEINSAFKTTADYRGEVIVGQLATDLYGRTRQMIHDFWLEARNRKTTYQSEFLSPASHRWFEITTSPIVNHRFVTTFFDITERKRAEDALKASSERWKLLFDILPVGVSVVDTEGSIIESNAALHTILRLGNNDVTATARKRQYYKSDYTPMRVEEFPSYRVFESGQIVRDVEIGVKDEDGREIWVSTNAAPLSEDKVVIVTADITERKRVGEKLHQSEENQQRILETIGVGVTVTRNGQLLFVNESFCRLIGYTAEEMRSLDFYDTVHPHSRQLIRERGLARMRGEDVPERYETQFCHKNGAVLWIDISAFLIEYGGATAVLATLVDITDRKRAEEALIMSYRDVKNFRSALEATALISITDAQGKIVYANEQFVALSQYSTQELIGNNHRMINSGYHDTEFFKNLWQTITSGEPWRGEIRNRAKDGSYYWVDAVISPMFDEHGEVYQYMAVRYDITGRKQSEEALRQSEERFRSIIDVSPVPYALNDDHGNITYLNPAFIQTFGYDLSDIPTLTEWWLRAYPDAVYRESVMVAWQEHLEKAEQGHKPFEAIDVEIHCKDGGQRSALVGAAAIGGTFHGTHLVILFDFTDRKQAERLLAASEERYRSFVELQGTYFLRTDLEGKYTYASPAHIQTFGMGKTSLIGRSGLEHIISEDHPKTFWAVEQCLQNPGTAVSVVLRKPSTSGRILWTEWEFITIQNAEGVVTEIQCVGHDITERKIAEQDLRELNQTLEERVEKRTRELVTLNNEKNEFLGIAAHDLKNPLSGILSSAEILERYFGGEAQSKRYVSMIVSASEQMLDIIENLLDVNKIESGLLKVHIIPISLEVVAAVVEDYQQRATTKGIILRYHTAPDELVPTVLADEQALWQVMDNLISNAVKYSPHWKSVSVRVLSRTDEEGKRFGRVEVQDEGPGISEADMHKLFAKFTRLTAQPTGGENSTGLGLSIVKKLVELQQGQVWCESELGKGANFIVEFPCT